MLGLGIELHHDFGSRKLIDLLHSLGYSVSYQEIRRFITSAAADELKSSSPYVPQGIQDVTDIASYIDAAIDNFDQNEETLDGKNTTHAMASVVFQGMEAPVANDIPRLTNALLELQVPED